MKNQTTRRFTRHYFPSTKYFYLGSVLAICFTNSSANAIYCPDGDIACSPTNLAVPADSIQAGMPIAPTAPIVAPMQDILSVPDGAAEPIIPSHTSSPIIPTSNGMDTSLPQSTVSESSTFCSGIGGFCEGVPTDSPVASLTGEPDPPIVFTDTVVVVGQAPQYEPWTPPSPQGPGDTVGSGGSEEPGGSGGNSGGAPQEPQPPRLACFSEEIASLINRPDDIKDLVELAGEQDLGEIAFNDGCDQHLDAMSYYYDLASTAAEDVINLMPDKYKFDDLFTQLFGPDVEIPIQFNYQNVDRRGLEIWMSTHLNRPEVRRLAGYATAGASMLNQWGVCINDYVHQFGVNLSLNEDGTELTVCKDSPMAGAAQ